MAIRVCPDQLGTNETHNPILRGRECYNHKTRRSGGGYIVYNLEQKVVRW